MKFRLGFVSNSSASSFCIFGINLTNEDIKRILSIDVVDINDIMIKLTRKLKKETDIKCYSTGDDSDLISIGRSYTSIRDDETGKQFKNSVRNKLSKLLHKRLCFK